MVGKSSARKLFGDERVVAGLPARRKVVKCAEVLDLIRVFL